MKQDVTACRLRYTEVTVLRDPAVKGDDCWRVAVLNRLCSPMFAGQGPALAYREMLLRGDRAPEYSDGWDLVVRVAR